MGFRRTSPRIWLLAILGTFLLWATAPAQAQPTDYFAPDEVTEEIADAYTVPGTHGWTIRTGALFLNGPHLSNTLLLSRGDLTPVMFGNALEIGAGTGWELEAEKQLNDEWTIGGRYFRVDSFTDQVNLSNLVNGAGVLYRNTVSGVLGAVVGGAAQVNYGADLESVELTAKRQVLDFMRISGGLRYLRFEDNVTARITGSGFTSESTLSASNEMAGAILGGDVLLLSRNRLDIWALGNAGVYLNDTDATLRIRNVNVRTSKYSTSRGAFVGELELKARYRLFEQVSLEGGYRLLWLDGIAFANEQGRVNNAPGTGAANVVANKDSLLLHGATLNLVVQF